MNTFTVEVDTARCTSCDACARECLSGNTRVTLGIDLDAPGGDSSFGELKTFLASRMSTRRFLPEEPSAETIARLADAARCTPSGGNRRAHELTILARGPTRELILAHLKKIYRTRSLLLNSPFLRMVMRPFVVRARFPAGPRIRGENSGSSGKAPPGKGANLLRCSNGGPLPFPCSHPHTERGLPDRRVRNGPGSTCIRSRDVLRHPCPERRQFKPRMQGGARPVRTAGGAK